MGYIESMGSQESDTTKPPPPEQVEGPSPADALRLAPMRPHGLLTSLTVRKQTGVVLCT